MASGGGGVEVARSLMMGLEMLLTGPHSKTQVGNLEVADII